MTQFIRILMATALMAGATAFADTVKGEQDFSCTGGELTLNFVLQEGSFNLPDGGIETQRLAATSPDSDVKVLGCAYTKVSHDEEVTPHCAVDKGALRYDIYPGQTPDNQIDGATVIAWTATGQVLQHVPMTCNPSK